MPNVREGQETLVCPTCGATFENNTDQSFRDTWISRGLPRHSSVRERLLRDFYESVRLLHSFTQKLANEAGYSGPTAPFLEHVQICDQLIDDATISKHLLDSHRSDHGC
jgi:hypothetical protein